MIQRANQIFLCALCFVAMPAFSAPVSELWSFWQSSDESNPEQMDHSLWQQILNRHIQPDTSGVNLFDYQSALDQSADQLVSYLEQMQELEPREFSSAEQKAYWINLYNALTVQLLLEDYPVSSITKLGRGFFKFGPWDDEVAQVAGQKLTLNDIEHRILRPIWQDPRIHFAVNCASMGCPNLQSIAFTSSNSDGLLEYAAFEFMSHPRALRFEGERLRLSSIFDWYGEDFGSSQDGVLVSLSSYVADEKADLLRDYSGKIDYDYDWALNDINRQ